MIEFRQKSFSFSSNLLKGAILGSSVGTVAANFGARFRKKRGDSDPSSGLDGLTTTFVGAGLGALVGIIAAGVDEVSNNINIRNTAKNRLMNNIVDALKAAGFKEGSDFTRDPKESNRLKTKICISVSKSDGDLYILVNQIADPKLKDVTKDLTKNIPNLSAVTEKRSDRFNELVITTISDSSADAGLVAGIAERFIRSGYPVYLIEVG